MITIDTPRASAVARLKKQLSRSRALAARYRNERDKARAELAVVRSKLDVLTESTGNDQ